MGQAVFKRIQFPCNYFGGKLAGIQAGTQPAAPFRVIEYLNYVSGGKKIYPECEQPHSMGCVAPDSIERSELGISIHLPLFVPATGAV